MENRKRIGSIALIMILTACLIAIVAYAMANGTNPIGPPVPSPDSQPTATPQPTATLVPTATPQPTATPGSGGGFVSNSGMPLPSDATPASAAFWGVPNVQFNDTGAGFNDAGDIFYEPWETEEEITINRVSFEVPSGNVDVNCRFALYDVDSHWQPVNLIHDYGNMSIGSTPGIFHLTGIWVVIPGSYVTAYQCGGISRGEFDGVSDITKVGDVSTANTLFRSFWNSDAPSILPGTPFPDPATASDKWQDWDITTIPGYVYSVMYRWDVN